MASYQSVIIKKTMLVHPKCHPQRTHELQLSNLDRKCPALMYLVLFYTKPPHRILSGDFVSELREGLEEILSAWYPAAGRLSLDKSVGRLNLDCRSHGAVWAEAETQVHVSQLGDFSHVDDRFLGKLVFRPHVSADRLTEMPLLVVQVTKFGCGGYAIGVGTNHALFDGSANFNFVSAWACKTSGRDDKLLEPVVHERGRLLIDHGQNHNHLAFPTETAQTTTRVIAFDHLYQLIKQATSLHALEGKLGAYEISGGGNDEFVLETFTLSKDMVEELKNKVDGSSCTSFEVVAAHLWKARTRAIETPQERTVCLQFSIDIRARLSPPLPRSFTGNAYVLSSVSSTCRDLLHQPLPSIVHKIQAAKNAVNDDYVRAYLLVLEAPQRALPALPELTVVSDWRHTPYHEVDFGIGGPACAVPLEAPLREVVYFMKSSREVGAVDVRIGLMRKHLVGFRRYFLEML